VVNTERLIETEDPRIISRKIKFEVFGEEMLVKEVKIRGKRGDWLCRDVLKRIALLT
jgi:hypothetical protein